MNLIKCLKVARSYGLVSIAQLECFANIAQNPGKGVVDLVGRPADHPDYRAFLGTVRKLMESGYRDDGLALVDYGAPIPGQPKGRELVLTRKGKALWRKLSKV